MADIYNSKLARFCKWLAGEKYEFAITTSKSCTRYSCSKEKVNFKWRYHEDIHKEQFSLYGWFPFVLMYLWESFLFGYYNNKYEVEARTRSNKIQVRK
jgi:hypothetical protein